MQGACVDLISEIWSGDGDACGGLVWQCVWGSICCRRLPSLTCYLECSICRYCKRGRCGGDVVGVTQPNDPKRAENVLVLGSGQRRNRRSCLVSPKRHMGSSKGLNWPSEAGVRLNHCVQISVIPGIFLRR